MHSPAPPKTRFFYACQQTFLTGPAQSYTLIETVHIGRVTGRVKVRVRVLRVMGFHDGVVYCTRRDAAASFADISSSKHCFFNTVLTLI
jgi:hypothetical protein